MEHVNISWTPPQTVQPHPPPVNVQTPYQPGGDWEFSSWIRDDETQTMPLQNLVREVFINMVVDRLKAKGLPLIACPHTRGLQLDNVINGIVDSHSVMCTHPNQQQDSQQQGIQLQDVNDDDVWEMEEASQLVKELTKTLSHSPGILNESENGKLDHRSPVKESTVQRKRPVSMVIGNLETPKKSPKRAKSSTGFAFHKCDKCDKTFKCAQELNRHRVTHFQDRPFKCKECDYHAKTAHEVNKHLRRIHLKQYPHHCVLCGKGYPSKSKLSLHEKTHLNIADKDKPFVCNHCGKGFFLSRLLNEHLAVHEKDKRYKCDLCPHLSITRKNRWRHLNKTHQVRATRKTSMCLVCNKELHEFHLLVAHMKENHEIAGIPCEICKAKFNSKSMLEHHLREEHEIMVRCEICRAKFKNKSMLQRHMRKEHLPNANCKECGLILESENALEVHMKRNHWFKCICKQCGKRFLNMTMLDTHRKRYHWTENKKTNEALTPSKLDKLKPHKQIKKKFTDGLKKTKAQNVDGGQAVMAPIKPTGSHAVVKKTRQNQLESSTTEVDNTKSNTTIIVVPTGLDGIMREFRSKKCTKTEMDETLDKELANIVTNVVNISEKNELNSSNSIKLDKSSDKNQSDTTEKTGNGQAKPPPQVRIPSANTQINKSESSIKKPEKCFTIYTKSPVHGQVAQMLAKGQLNLSLNINIPGTSNTASIALSLPKKSSVVGASGSTSDTATTTGNSSDSVMSFTHATESSGQLDKPQLNLSVTNEHAYSAPSSAKNTSTDGKQVDNVVEEEKGIQQADGDNLVTERTPVDLFTECKSKETQQAEIDMSESTPSSCPPNQKPEIAGEDQTETQQAECDVMTGSISSNERQEKYTDDQSKELHPAYTTGTHRTASSIFPSFVVNISGDKAAECESKGTQQANIDMTESTPSSCPPNQKPEIAGEDQTETQQAECDVMTGTDITSDERQKDQSKELHPTHTTDTHGTVSSIFPSFVVNISEVKSNKP